MPSDSEKIDHLIHLSEERGDKIEELTRQVERLSGEVSNMAPTVRQVAEAIAFARVGRTVFRFLIGLGVGAMGVIWWMEGKWYLFAALFKRTP